MGAGLSSREDLGDLAGLAVGGLVLLLVALGDPVTIGVGALLGLLGGMLLIRGGAIRGGVLAAALGAVVGGLFMAGVLLG